MKKVLAIIAVGAAAGWMQAADVVLSITNTVHISVTRAEAAAMLESGNGNAWMEFDGDVPMFVQVTNTVNLYVVSTNGVGYNGPSQGGVFTPFQVSGDQTEYRYQSWVVMVYSGAPSSVYWADENMYWDPHSDFPISYIPFDLPATGGFVLDWVPCTNRYIISTVEGTLLKIAATSTVDRVYSQGLVLDHASVKASAATLGHVKVGAGLNIDENGLLGVSASALTPAPIGTWLSPVFVNGLSTYGTGIGLYGSSWRYKSGTAGGAHAQIRPPSNILHYVLVTESRVFTEGDTPGKVITLRSAVIPQEDGPYAYYSGAYASAALGAAGSTLITITNAAWATPYNDGEVSLCLFGVHADPTAPTNYVYCTRTRYKWIQP